MVVHLGVEVQNTFLNETILQKACPPKAVFSQKCSAANRMVKLFLFRKCAFQKYNKGGSNSFPRNKNENLIFAQPV